MGFNFANFEKLIYLIRKHGGLGYFSIGNIQVIVYDTSFVIITIPPIDENYIDTEDYFLHVELSDQYESNHNLFAFAFNENNVDILKRLYLNKYDPYDIFQDPDDEQEYIQHIFAFSRNEEAVQFVIDHWPKFIEKYVTVIRAKNNGNITLGKYQLSKGFRPTVLSYLKDNDMEDEEVSLSYLKWLHDNGLADFRSAVKSWDELFRITPTAESLAYIFQQYPQGYILIGNKLRWFFYKFASNGEKEKWYDYIDKILIDYGVPIDYEELFQMTAGHTNQVSFLRFLYQKGHYLTTLRRNINTKLYDLIWFVALHFAISYDLTDNVLLYRYLIK